MNKNNLQNIVNKDFIGLINSTTGENINQCYQCKKCSAGCPVVYEMDYTPTQIIQAVRLGMRDLVLKSKTIWLCSSCDTCTTRCPQDIDIAGVMDTARIISRRQGITPAVRDIPSFNESFLQVVGMFGRSYELGMIALLKFRTKKFTKDLKLGFKLFKLGKLKILPQVSNKSKISSIFSKVGKMERDKK